MNLDFVHCIEEYPEEECATEKEAKETLNGLLIYFQLDYKQLDMKNFTNPLQDIVAITEITFQAEKRYSARL